MIGMGFNWRGLEGFEFLEVDLRDMNNLSL
jgi:hypothetical protein